MHRYKKSDPKDTTCYDAISMTFWKRKIHRDEEQTSKGPEVGEELTTKGQHSFPGVGKCLPQCDDGVVKWLHSHENSQNSPQRDAHCKTFQNTEKQRKKSKWAYMATHTCGLKLSAALSIRVSPYFLVWNHSLVFLSAASLVAMLVIPPCL